MMRSRLLLQRLVCRCLRPTDVVVDLMLEGRLAARIWPMMRPMNMCAQAGASRTPATHGCGGGWLKGLKKAGEELKKTANGEKVIEKANQHLNTPAVIGKLLNDGNVMKPGMS